jgi:hypothetical protein
MAELLDMVPTETLIESLLRRHDGGLIVLRRDMEQGSSDLPSLSYGGGPFGALGMAVWAVDALKEFLVTEEEED